MPLSVVEQAASGSSGAYTGISAFFLFLAIVSFPAGLVFELSGWLYGKIFGKEEERKTGEFERAGSEDSMEKLDKLNDLKEKGAISEEEFQEKKQDLLGDV